MENTIVLSKEVSGTPKNAPTLTFKRGLKLSLGFLTSAGDLVDEIEERVTALDGRPRLLTVMTLMAVLIASALSGELHISKAVGDALGMSASARQKFGLRWRVGGDWVDVSYRMLWHTFTLIAVAYDDSHPHHWTRRRLQHNHLVAHPAYDMVFDPNTGEVVDEVDVRVGDCGPECPVGRVIEDLGNDLLAAFYRYTNLPTPETQALDSHPLETYFSQRSYGGIAYIEPGVLPESAVGTPLTVHGPNGKATSGVGKPMTAAKRRTIRTARAEWDANPDHEVKKSPRSLPVMGPTAPGTFMRKDPNFPRIAHDERLMHSLDWGAGDTYRGGGPGRPPEIVHGRDCHVASPGGRMPSGRSWPQLAMAIAPRKGGSSKAEPALAITRSLRRNGLSPEVVSADGGYTKDDDALLARELMENGQWLSIALGVGQGTGQPGPKEGVLYTRGWYFSEAMPTALRDLPLHGAFDTRDEHMALAARYDRCLRYRFRVHSRSGSTIRLRGPGVAKVTKDDSGTVIALRDYLVICPNSPHYEHMLQDQDGLDAPITNCTPGEPCGCNITITIQQDDFDSFTTPLVYGTTDWYQRKGRRIAIEQFNARVQKRFKLGSFSIQMRPDRWDLAYVFLILAYNLLTFYKWIIAKGGLYAVRDGRSPFDPALVQAILNRPVPSPEAEPTTEEPDPPAP